MLVKTIIESLYYILTKLGPCSKIKLIKLMYIADKHHLLKFGRTITNDTFYAMKNGPVGSKALDVLNLKDNELT